MSVSCSLDDTYWEKAEVLMVKRLFLAVPWGCLRFMIVVFPYHTHLLFLALLYVMFSCAFVPMPSNRTLFFPSKQSINASLMKLCPQVHKIQLQNAIFLQPLKDGGLEK